MPRLDGSYYDPMLHSDPPYSAREPMRRRAVRLVVRCTTCDVTNDVTHGQAHASAPDYLIPCRICETPLPKDQVQQATRGRANPLNARA